MRTRLIVEGLLFVSLCSISVVLVRHFLAAHDVASSLLRGDAAFLPDLPSSWAATAAAGARRGPGPLPLGNNESAFDAPSLNDKTLDWPPRVPMPYLSLPSGDDKPSYKLLLTDFRWNGPDQHQALNHSRVLRTRELLQGVVDHPHFDPRGWQDFAAGRRPVDPNVRYYVFLDVETCYEANYPHYGASSYTDNFDSVGGRAVSTDHLPLDCYFIHSCPFVERVLQSSLFRHPKAKSRLIYFDCLGLSIAPRFRASLQPSPKLALASLSAQYNQHRSSVDQGLPPPAVTRFSLSPEQERTIEACNETDRTYFFTFVGVVRATHSARIALAQLHDPSRGVVSLHRRSFQHQYPNMSYTEMLQRSIFAAAPRGDNLFSYRFAEVLAAGAIPVIHADNWVLPFRSELVDWSECAVRLPESHANETIVELRRISSQERCRRRRRCYEIHATYMATPEGTIRGLVEGLELVAEAA